MSEIANTYKLSNNTELRILYDLDPIDPRSEDNLSSMVCFHRRYNLGDNHDYSSSDFNDWSELKEQIEKDNDIAIILPLYLYDHSGITISTSPFSCSWDSGQIGYIFITKETIRNNYNVKRISKKMLERIRKYLLSEVETYDHYLTGQVFGFQIIEKSFCEKCETEEEDIIDSCWGFYGYNLTENGILEYLDSEQRQIIKAQL